MIANVDRRREPRLRYSWDGQLYVNNVRGGLITRMVDINSDGAAFLLDNRNQLWAGQDVELGLTYPKIVNGKFDILHNRLNGTVYRNEWYNDAMRRVVVRFDSPMSESPAVGNEYIYQ